MLSIRRLYQQHISDYSRCGKGVSMYHMLSQCCVGLNFKRKFLQKRREKVLIPKKHTRKKENIHFHFLLHFINITEETPEYTNLLSILSENFCDFMA